MGVSNKMAINTARISSLGAVLLLSACATVPPPAAELPGAEESATAVNGARQLGNIDSEVIEAQMAERQALIEAINRDGRPVSGGRSDDRAPTPVTPPGTDVVVLNYEQGELRDILADMADALDITLVIDPTISEVVSLRTAANRPLAYADIWPLMRLLTRQAGVVVEEVDNIYYARRSDAALPFALATPDTLAGSRAGTVLQITPLRHLSATAALELLGPLLEGEGMIQRIANSQVLAITASASQLRRVNELLRLIDDDPFRNQGIQLYPLAMASASELAEELYEVLQLIEGEHPAYQVMALPRINAILVTAPASRGFTEISRWVQLLDADRQEQREQLFRYRVKNLNATDLAVTLTEVFRSDDRNDDEPRQSPAELRRQTEDGLQAGLESEPAAPATTVAQIAVSADLRVSIVADDATNSLLIRATPRDYQQLLATISQLDIVPL
jgi:general secretion pathway protein D